MPRSKKFTKENLPLDLQAQLHKKTWVKTEHDKAVKVHHDNIDRVRELESKIDSSLRKLKAIGHSIDLLQQTAEQWSYENLTSDQAEIVARVNHLPFYGNQRDDYDLGECQGHKYTDGAAILVSNQIDICKQITDFQADIDSNTFDMSVKKMWKDADEEMLGKKYDRLVKKGEITPPTTQAILEEDS